MPLEAAIPGFYVAHGRWLDLEYGAGALHKVGHSGDLGARLRDGAYLTCFPPGHWSYATTFETATKEEAALLETAVLHCCRFRREGGSELVRLAADAIADLASALAAALGLACTRRERPVYPARPRARHEPEAAPGPRHEGEGALAGWGHPQRVLAEPFTLAPEGPAAPDVAEPPRAGGDATAVVPAPAPVGGLDRAEDEPFDLDVGSPFDLESAGGAPADDAAPAAVELREYQREAVAACLRELHGAGRAVLQMACRCGKTPVAYGVLREYLAAGGSVLYLVPGLSLLRQTAQKLVAYGLGAPVLLVGSDPHPVALGGRSEAMTTDPGAVGAFVGARGARLVVCTYQSSPLLPPGAFALTVFDEAHRTCGGDAPRPFNHAVLAPRAGARLFMTATPAYDPPSRAPITMKDRAVFGGVAYRYHLRQGIAAGHVNGFRLELVVAALGEPGSAPPASRQPAAADAVAPAQLHAALAQVDKLLVFCRDIGHATRLCDALRAAPLPPGTHPFESLTAHSRMGAGGAAAALRRFSEPGVRAVLFNCRLFQEGVEIPALNGVFFAAPRHSPRDIIQSVCRPLNRTPGKPTSVVFLPVLHDPALPPEDPANLKRYASVVPFVDALLDEDPRLYEHLLDPAGTPYPVSVLGTHSLRLEDGACRARLLAAVRRAVRYGGSGAANPAERLLRVENVPWERAFGALRRVVETCGRYPKTTDLFLLGEAKANLHGYYRHYAEAYLRCSEGEPALEPYQVAALESLPGWRPYGVEGPYPWGRCMAFLERWLEEHGEPPMVNINNGGYVGLDASDMERLSGCLTCINQGDGRARKGKEPGSGFTIRPEKQADLDRICQRFGLRWRKARTPAGGLVKDGPPSFIQEAYARFKAYYKAHGADGAYIRRWFEGFPLKHKAMENLSVQKAGSAPPRRRTARARRRAQDAGGDGPDAPGGDGPGALDGDAPGAPGGDAPGAPAALDGV